MEIIGKPSEIIKKILDNLDNEIEYDVQIKKHRKKRSLNANSYCWILLEKMAIVLGTTKTELYVKMLKEYGKFEYHIVKENQVESIENSILEQGEKEKYRAVIDLGKVKVISDKGEKEGVQLQLFIGSSHYNTKEMSRFIEGIVYECKELEIETMTPMELAKLKEEW